VLVLLMLALTVSVAAAKGDPSGGMYHTVSYGETLYSIGRYYGISPHAIARANILYNPNYIYAGQVLYIPSGGGHPGHPGYPPGGGQNGVHHKVRWGETTSSIARMYGSTVWAITRVNGLHNPNYIYAGQVLYVPYGGGNWGWDGCHSQPNCGSGYHPRPEQPIYYPPVPTPYY
jgi:LysM repeat protein